MKPSFTVLAGAAVLLSLTVAGQASPAVAETISPVVSIRSPDGTALTLDLVEVPIVGPDFGVLTQGNDSTFTDVTSDLVQPRTFLGTVEGRPDAMVAATRLSTGDLWGQVVFDRGATWYFQNDVVTSTRGLESPAAFEAWPTRESLAADTIGADQYSFQVGLDIDNAYYTTVARGSAQTVVDHSFHSLNNMRAIYMRDLGLTPELGTVRIRASADADPYADLAATTHAYLPVLRDQWRTEFAGHPNDQVNVITSRTGGGIAYGVSFDPEWTYAVTGAPKTDWDIVLRHEVAHNFFLADNHAGGFEGKTIESGNEYARFDSAEVHTFATVRQARVDQGILTPQGTYETTLIPPYAATDLVDVVAGTTGAPVSFRPLVNDHSANGSDLRLEKVDTTSMLGAHVEVDPDGTVRYTPLPSPTAAIDHFFYSVVDINGMTATGLVLVRNSTTFKIFEAEDLQLAGAQIHPSTSDLSGNFSGEYISVNPDGTVTLTVNSPEERDVTLSVRMRNASSRNPSATDVTVNGRTGERLPAPQGSTYSPQVQTIHLKKGENEIRYTVRDAAQRLDSIRVDWPDAAPRATAPPPVNAISSTPFAYSVAPFFVDPDNMDESTDTLIFSLVSGPPWLQVSGDGRVSGTPSEVGTTSAVIRATDAFGASVTTSLSLTVTRLDPLPSNPPEPPGPKPSSSPAETPAEEQTTGSVEFGGRLPPTGGSLTAQIAGLVLSTLLIGLGLWQIRSRFSNNTTE